MYNMHHYVQEIKLGYQLHGIISSFYDILITLLDTCFRPLYLMFRAMVSD